MQRMFAYFKAQVKNPRMPESGFTLDQIMLLHINFHKLALTRGSSYIKLPECIAKKKIVINPKYKDGRYCKWAVIAALHNEDIKHHPERISLLQHYEDRYNCQWLEFSLAIQKIGNNPAIVVNVLFNSMNGIYTACRSERNGK